MRIARKWYARVYQPNHPYADSIGNVFQFVNWFPEWVGFRILKDEHGLKYIYDWRLSFAFWEVRKWHTFKPVSK